MATMQCYSRESHYFPTPCHLASEGAHVEVEAWLFRCRATSPRREPARRPRWPARTPGRRVRGPWRRHPNERGPTTEQLRDTKRVPAAFASRLAHERDTPSCRAAAATVMPALFISVTFVHPAQIAVRMGIENLHLNLSAHAPHSRVMVALRFRGRPAITLTLLMVPAIRAASTALFLSPLFLPGR